MLKMIGMGNERIDISVIIINYNTCRVTCKCLESIFNMTKNVNYEVILVDNNSTDGSSEYFLDYPGIKYIRSNTNIGFGKANNLAYKVSRGKYILFLNSDTLLVNNALKCFYDEFEKMPNSVGCIGGKLLKADLSPNHSFGVFPSLKNDLVNYLNLVSKVFGFKINRFNERDFDSLLSFKVDYITGADLCVRRSLIDECGLFDPDFFMYFEETEMQNRYSRAGYSSYIVDTPKIIHLEGASSKRKSFKNRHMFYSSNIIYAKKTYSIFAYYFYRVILIASIPMLFKSYFSVNQINSMITLFFSSYTKIRDRYKKCV